MLALDLDESAASYSCLEILQELIFRTEYSVSNMIPPAYNCTVNAEIQHVLDIVTKCVRFLTAPLSA